MRSSLLTFSVASALIAQAAGCMTDAGDDLAGTDDAAIVGGKADAADTELRARIDGLTVWMEPGVTVETRDDRRYWVLHGRASRNLDHVFSFVPDDPFAIATVTGKRTFDVAFDAGHEINTLISGLP